MLALAIVAALTLIVVLRALLLPLIAVALNLATIAAALGALELLTETHVLGGPGYIDAASGAGIISIMFVLSIDYEVFPLTRMREQWIARGDAQDAIRYGLRHTTSVITGFAAIMTAVFLAFAAADVIPLRQFGVGRSRSRCCSTPRSSGSCCCPRSCASRDRASGGYRAGSRAGSPPLPSS